jgi:hypothetical protein
MIRPGRKSAAELASPPVDGSSPRLRPPEHLDDRERALFVELINACAPQHFVKSDAPLLAAYVQIDPAVAISGQTCRQGSGGAGVVGEINANDGNAGTRLRLSPQSRLDPKSVGRMRPCNGPRPWDDDFLDKREALNANAD